MREILFKAKRLDNGEWFEGVPVDVTPLVCFASDKAEQEVVMVRAGFADWGMPRGMEYTKVDSSTVCQYTGLKDKNGKRIFEGDNVYDPHENSIYTVEWNENNAIFQMAHDWHRRSVETAYYCEIIGNIYDGEGGQ